jgi:acyl dehydratase
MPAQVFENVEQLRPMAGREIGLSDWITVDQGMIDAFAAATGDRQWIHIDPARAKVESPYGATVAHGFLTLALLSRLSGEAIQVHGVQRRINYGLNRLRFPAAVVADSRIRARIFLGAFEDIPGGIHLTWNVTVELEGSDKPVLVAEWLVRYYL